MAVKGTGTRRLQIPEEDRRELERIVRASSSEVRMVERARIVLAAGEGLSTAQIAERVGCSERTVKKWRPRYTRRGLAGLRDAPRSGAPLTHFTKAEPSDRAGSGLSGLLLWVSRRRERQPAAGFSGGD